MAWWSFIGVKKPVVLATGWGNHRFSAIRTGCRRPCRQSCWPLAWVQALGAEQALPPGVQPVPNCGHWGGFSLPVITDPQAVTMEALDTMALTLTGFVERALYQATGNLRALGNASGRVSFGTSATKTTPAPSQTVA